MIQRLAKLPHSILVRNNTISAHVLKTPLYAGDDFQLARNIGLNSFSSEERARPVCRLRQS